MSKQKKEFNPLLFAVNCVAEITKGAKIVSKAKQADKHNPNGPDEATKTGHGYSSNENSGVVLGTGVKKKRLVTGGGREKKIAPSGVKESTQDKSTKSPEEPEVFKKKEKSQEEETEPQQGVDESAPDKDSQEETREPEPGEREEEEAGEGERTEEVPEGEDDSFNAADSLHEFLAKSAIDPSNLTDDLVRMMLGLIAFDAGYDDYDVEAAFQSFKSMPAGGDPSVDQPDPELNAAQVTLARFIEAVGGDVQKATKLLSEYVSKFGTEALNESAGEQVPPTPQQSEEMEGLTNFYLNEAGFASKKASIKKKAADGEPGICIECGKECETLGNDICCLCTGVEESERCPTCQDRAGGIYHPDTY